MSVLLSAAAGPLLGRGPFRLYFAARTASEFAYQISAVAVGWQIYGLTGSALALGLVGLAEFLPTLLLTVVSGHVVDRYDRRRVAQACQAALALIAGWLAWRAYAGALTAPEIFVAVMALGAAIRSGE